MPVTESAEYAKFNTIGLTKRPDSIQAEGRIRYLNDVVTLVGDETTGSVSLLPVPKDLQPERHRTGGSHDRGGCPEIRVRVSLCLDVARFHRLLRPLTFSSLEIQEVGAV